MNKPEEKENIPGTKLSRIYKTDSFGFPLNQADEEISEGSRKDKKEKSGSSGTDLPGSDVDDKEAD